MNVTNVKKNKKTELIISEDISQNASRRAKSIDNKYV